MLGFPGGNERKLLFFMLFWAKRIVLPSKQVAKCASGGAFRVHFGRILHAKCARAPHFARRRGAVEKERSWSQGLHFEPRLEPHSANAHTTLRAAQCFVCICAAEVQKQRLWRCTMSVSSGQTQRGCVRRRAHFRAWGCFWPSGIPMWIWGSTGGEKRNETAVDTRNGKTVCFRTFSFVEYSQKKAPAEGEKRNETAETGQNS